MSEPTNGGQARAFQALRESEELHRATLGSISDAVFLTDDDGLFTFICPNVDVIFGYVPDEVQAMTRISGLLGDNLFDRAELGAQGEIKNIEREVRSKTGERRTLLIHLKKVAIQGSTVLYSCRDVTERKHAEDELRAARLDLAHASRLALVGELIASIAHEINQPLTSILGNASAGFAGSARNRPADAAELREIFVDIRDQGRRSGDVVERLRAWRASGLWSVRPSTSTKSPATSFASSGAKHGGAASRSARSGAIAPGHRRRPRVPAAGHAEPDDECHGRDGSAGGRRATGHRADSPPEQCRRGRRE